MNKFLSFFLLPCVAFDVVRGVPVPRFATTNASKVDTHIHAIPYSYANALTAAGFNDTPAWSLPAMEQFLDQAGISVAILSISTPGVSILGTGDAARRLARTLNKELGSYVTNSSLNSPTSSLGFFGALPDWQDVNGTLAELDYLYKKQKLCNGVAVYTSYGNKLLGDPTFTPIWAKLQEYKALIFIHPNGLDIIPDLIGPALPQYVIDFLWATTRTATDLVMTGTLSASPDVDIILAHAGGAVPYTGTRALESLLIPSIADVVNVNYVEAQAQFARFYYDLALSSSTAQLDGLLDFSDAKHIGFGSDFPYAPTEVVELITGLLTPYQVQNMRGPELGGTVLKQNSLELLNKHSLGRLFF